MTHWTDITPCSGDREDAQFEDRVRERLADRDAMQELFTDDVWSMDTGEAIAALAELRLFLSRDDTDATVAAWLERERKNMKLLADKLAREALHRGE